MRKKKILKMAQQAANLDMRFIIDCITSSEGGGRNDAVLLDGSYISPSTRAMPHGSRILSLEDQVAWDEYEEWLEAYVDSLNEKLAGSIYWENGMLMFKAHELSSEPPETFLIPLVGMEGAQFLTWTMNQMYPCSCANNDRNCSVDG